MEDFFNNGVNSLKLHDNILHEYVILNYTNFFPSPFKEKGGFLRVGVRIRVNIQFTMIINLFTSRLREGECKYLIHNNNGFIHPLLVRGTV